MAGDAVLVHPNPGRIEQHRSAGGAQEVGQQRAQQQEQRVDMRRRLPFDVNVNAAGDDEQRADQHDEAHVLTSHVQYPLISVQPKDIVEQSDRPE